MARRAVLAALLLLTVLCGAHGMAQGSTGEDTHFHDAPNDPDDSERENLQDILVDAASDIQKTIAHSEHPLLELREKYGMSMQRGVIGGAVGYAVARIAKHFALSTLKLTFAGALLYTGAAAFGYIARDPADIVDQLQNGAAQATSAISRKLDLNGDGRANVSDLRLAGRRLERAVLRNSVAASLGVAAGAFFALLH